MTQKKGAFIFTICIDGEWQLWTVWSLKDRFHIYTQKQAKKEYERLKKEYPNYKFHMYYNRKGWIGYD